MFIVKNLSKKSYPLKPSSCIHSIFKSAFLNIKFSDNKSFSLFVFYINLCDIMNTDIFINIYFAKGIFIL